MRSFIFFAMIPGLALSALSCDNETDPFYRDSMRDFVGDISSYSKTESPGFIVIPQNGIELVSIAGNGDNDPHSDYLEAIDGVGQEDLFYGYSGDDDETPERESNYLLSFLDICEQNSVEVLVTDYCSTHSNVDRSYNINLQNGFISYAAPERELNTIPSYPAIINENSNDINTLSDAGNFLYLINPDQYNTASEFIQSLSETNYDLLIIDLFFSDTELLPSMIETLQTKNNGSQRLVIAYMSIGEAEDYRYYWKDEWNKNAPEWLEKENPKWEGNYKVKYWDADWQSLILGNDNSYLDKIIAAGFDGVYLDIIEAFEYFE
jgi:cysteinyl-tRNA synthetase